MVSPLIDISISQDVFHLGGAESAEATITIRNTNDIVDVLTLAVEDLDENWYEISADRASLFPGDQFTSVLKITPPRSTDAASGEYAFAIHVTSQKVPDEESRLYATLRLASYFEYEARIVANNGGTARIAHFEISMTNTGNAPMVATLSGTSDGVGCEISFEPQSLEAEPGKTASSTMTVRATDQPLRGGTITHSISATVSPTADVLEPTVLSALLNVPPRLPKWAPLAIIMGAVAVVAILGGLIAAVIISGDTTYRAALNLPAGQDVSFDLNPPEAGRATLSLSVDWQDGPSSIQVILIDPNGSGQQPRNVGRSELDKFQINEVGGESGLDGWIVNIKNLDQEADALGSASWSFSDVK